MIKPTLTTKAIEKLIQPETTLEKLILQQPIIRKGLMWGKPRKGHPEGKVLYHVREVLDNIDELATNDFNRKQLRIIAILHDAFKFQEDLSFPRDWSKHHAVLARQFAEKFITDPPILEVIEWHDEAYYCWRAMKCRRSHTTQQRHCIQRLMDRLGDHIELYFQFFKCDTQTGDKTQEPLYWFGEQVMGSLNYCE